MDGGGKPQNYTLTNDPDVVIGKYGVRITRAEFEHANKNGYAWKDFPAYAEYTGGWAKPIANPIPISPYYRAYGQQTNIPGMDVAILHAKYGDDPKISQILQRNIAKPGEAPMYGPEDADVIRKLITKERVTSQASHDPNFGLAQAVAALKSKP